MKILVATHNKRKLDELKSMFHQEIITLLTLDDLEDSDEVVENGKSYKANALLKARYYFNKYHIPVLADDSGLSVSYLRGRPGIYSARFTGGDDAHKNETMLNLLQNVNQRRAQFVCHMAFIDNKGKEHHFKGILKGQIAHHQSGHEGFGYDPIFIPYDAKLSLASLGANYKNKHSHRARAYQKFGAYIHETFNSK